MKFDIRLQIKVNGPFVEKDSLHMSVCNKSVNKYLNVAVF